ncbi:MAG: DUF523 domain-containing protein [Bacillota bacterium]
MDRVLVSACLLGVQCRYDGEHEFSAEVVAAAATRCLVPVCPEILGGLPTPRPPAEVVGGDGADVLAGRARVVTGEGRDVTAAFLRGAQEALRVARLVGAREAWLKARSPSCGVTCIHDGTFAQGMRPGAGVTAALLARGGIRLLEFP